MADFLNPNLNLITRTRRLMAETRDLKEWRVEWRTALKTEWRAELKNQPPATRSETIRLKGETGCLAGVPFARS